MSDQHPLTDVVQLYRMAGCPDMDGNTFSGQLDFATARHLIERLREQDTRNGRFSEVRVDQELIADGQTFPVSGDRVKFDFQVAIQGDAQFYIDIENLCKIRSIGRGKFPENFYLVGEDYQHGQDETIPESVRNLRALAALVRSLSELSDHHYETTGSGAWTLLFLTNDQNAALETRISSSMIKSQSPVMKALLDDLLSHQSGIHQSEKRLMFSATMCEVLKGGVTFSQFIDRSEKLVELYQNNLKTYLSGFSFEQARREVADAQTQFAERLSKTVNDMTAKLLGLPVSMFAVFAVLRTEHWLEQFLMLVAAIMASYILYQMIHHQKKQLQQIAQSKDLVFKALESRSHADNYPEELKDAIRTAICSLQSNTRALRRTLNIYTLLAWLPGVSSTIALLHSNHTQITGLLVR